MMNAYKSDVDNLSVFEELEYTATRLRAFIEMEIADRMGENASYIDEEYVPTTLDFSTLYWAV